MATPDLPMVATQRWRARGAVAWLLTLVAVLLAAVAALLAFYMIKLVDWNGLGRAGAVTFWFPLHILVASLVVGALAWLAQRLGARLAAALFAAVADHPELQEVIDAVLETGDTEPRHLAEHLDLPVSEVNNRLKRLRRRAIT